MELKVEIDEIFFQEELKRALSDKVEFDFSQKVFLLIQDEIEKQFSELIKQKVSDVITDRINFLLKEHTKTRQTKDKVGELVCYDYLDLAINKLLVEIFNLIPIEIKGQNWCVYKDKLPSIVRGMTVEEIKKHGKKISKGVK